MRFLDAEAVDALGPRGAVDAITEALRGGLDPDADAARIGVPLAAGQFLLMPSEGAGAAGVKIATVAPGNPARGLPRIEATYLLYDGETLRLRAALDGTALTTLRTPAVSVAAVLPGLPEQPLHVVVVGTGPQATGHAATLAAVREVASLTYLARDPGRAPIPALALGGVEAEDAVRAADVVVCATSARNPVLDTSLVRDDAVVVAVGSHEPDARELDAAMLARGQVVVETVASSLREAGDVVLAIEEGALTASDLVPMADLVTGAVPVAGDRPLVFKGVGMAWQDLVVAEAVLRRTDS